MLLVLHISDIHIKKADQLKPIDSVIAAIRGLNIFPEGVVVVITGDITWSGQEEQFFEADSYFTRLLNSISQELNCPVHFVACPGNHDCAFPEDNGLRDLAVESIRVQGQLPSSQLVISQCVDVQKNFFSWLNTVPSLESVEEGALAWLVPSVVCGGVRLHFRVLNTSWASTVREEQGKLFFPPSIIPEIPTSDLRISLFHHPYNWFRSENGRDLRRILEESSDLILTGHEHDSTYYHKTDNHAQSVAYIEGGVFNDGRGLKSSFNIVEIDLKKSQYRCFALEWRHDRYSAEGQAPLWQKFICTTSSISRENRLSQDMNKFLKDPGAHLMHSATNIELEDIFVAPDLQKYEGISNEKPPSRALIPSVNTTNQLFENKYAYILGSAQSGKTSLAKMMYLRAVRQGLFPVYLYGSDIASTKPESLQLLVERALRRQISKVHKEEFWQAPQDQRFIVVDDFNGVKVNSQAKQIVTEWLKKIFGYVFIISGERTQLEDIVFQNREGEPFRGFKRYDIRSFGYHLRDVIIEKWLTLGEKRHFLEYEELHHQIRSTADTINRILGRNLLPAYPVFIFIILQQLDADIPIETTSGSYGYFYEMLITTSLRQVSRSPDDVDAKYTYLAHFAWFLFRSNGKVCDSEALSKFTKNHCEEYGLVDDPEMLKREVLSSRLVVFINGQYRFAYRYLYYYFIARYMRDNYDSSETEALIGRAIGELHREDYSNVLVFLTYLTKKKSIMELLLEKSRSLMTSIEPCDLSEHVAFISRLQDQLPGIMVDDEDPIKSRAKIFQAIDASSSGDEEAESAPSFDEKHEEKAERESFFAQYRMSARLLQVIGQILRNFSGSLKRDMKVGIAKECLDIGFKRLNLQYRAVENNIDRALTFIQELSSKSIEHMDDQERKEFASKCLLLVTEWMCFTALAEISSAIGSEQLIRTYEDLDHRHNTRALKFAQLYIRLEHFREFPEKKVFELFDDVKNDIFGLTLLRLMVGEHFYLFPRPERIKQRVCSRLGITLQSVHRLTAIAKV